MPAKESPDVSALLRAYLAADYECLVHGRRYPLWVGETAPAVEAALPEGRTFALITAWNPRSVARTPSENRAADQALRQALAAAGARFHAGAGMARDRGWREPGWLVVDMSLADFDALARRFDQLGALFWRRGEPVRLRMHARQPADDAGHAAVDWLA